MHSQTVAAPHPPDNTTSPKPKRAGQKSPWRVLHDRLQLAGVSANAGRVAVALHAYARVEQGSGRLVAAVYHGKLAGETRMSLSSVRRALRELTAGENPLFIARARDGRKRTFRYAGGGSRETYSAFYEWIDDLETFRAARDTARTANVIDYEQRKREHRPEVLDAQRRMLVGEITEAEYTAKVEQIDARARGRMPKAATTHKPTRCLTPAQIIEFAADLDEGGAYRDLVKGGQKRVRQFHALHRHVFGGSGWDGCRTCELAVAQRLAVVDQTSYFKNYGANVAACGCGAVVVQFPAGHAATFVDVLFGNTAAVRQHDCPHEQNRLLKLRAGRP